MTMTREEAIRIIETVFQDEYVYKYYDSITHQALDMAIEALSEQNCVKCEHYYETEEDGVVGHCRMDTAHRMQGEWIPCSERLPKARESVILSTKEWTGEGCYWETTKHHVIWKGYRWNATYWDDEVTAWKPLPEPYREDGEA